MLHLCTIVGVSDLQAPLWFMATYLGPSWVCCCPWCWSIIRLRGEVSLLCNLSWDSYIYYLLFKVKDFQKPVAAEIESGLSLPNVCRWFLYFGQFHLKFSFWKIRGGLEPYPVCTLFIYECHCVWERCWYLGGGESVQLGQYEAWLISFIFFS